MEPQEKSGVGSLLKAKREDKGLSIDRVAEITKLRKHYVQALEDEAWDELPSRVYVKGFIKSYAQGVGFDPEEAISLYEETSSVEEKTPKPLKGFKVPKRKPVFSLLILIAILVIIIYLLAVNKTRIFEDKGDLAPVREEESLETPPVEENSLDQIEPEQELEEQIPEPEEKPPRPKEPQTQALEEDLPDLPEEEAEISRQEAGRSPAPEKETIDSEPTGDYVLTATVNSRTYIKIYVDDKPPKEYIFQPGSRPKWTGEEGFDILVGNAGGVELVFNGKRINDLGEIGQVIRVNLPEGFKSELYKPIKDID